MHMPCTCHAHTDHAHRMLMVHGFFDSNPTAKQAPQWHNACGFKTEQCNETPNALKPFKTVFFSTGCANVMAMCNKIVKRNLLPKEVSLRWPQGWPLTTSTCQNPGAKIIQCAIFPEIIFNVFDVFTLSIATSPGAPHGGSSNGGLCVLQVCFGVLVSVLQVGFCFAKCTHVVLDVVWMWGLAAAGPQASGLAACMGEIHFLV